MNITFGICTYNRKDILEKSALSLKEIEGYENINIRLYDDHSDEYDIEYLKLLFPTAKTIKVQEKNLGADLNTAYMYQDFLDSEDDFFFNADSDLIYRKDILKIIEDILPYTDGFFSTFNTSTHRNMEKEEGLLIEKKDVGAAGCCFSREVIKIILENVKINNLHFDYAFCECMKSEGIHIWVCKNSLVQHIGISGYNSSSIFFDYGMNFLCDNHVNAQIIEDTFEKHMKMMYLYKKSIHCRFYFNVICFPKRFWRLLIRRMKYKMNKREN